jgi:hypothetical protein
VELCTETRVGEYNDTNKTIKVVYICAFVGELNSNILILCMSGPLAQILEVRQGTQLPIVVLWV